MYKLFDCAICERPVTDYVLHRNGRERHLAPLCRSCEGEYGGRGLPKAGAFMDRRIAAQISALAEALSCMAHYIEWERRYGRA